MAQAERPVVLVRVRGEVAAMAVDAVLDARELILQDVGRLLWRVRGVGGGALPPDGRVMFVLDPDSLETGRGVAVNRSAVARLRPTPTRCCWSSCAAWRRLDQASA